MDLTVENLCNLIVRSKLMVAKDVRAVYQRWTAEAKKSASDTAAFSRWLVAGKYLTEYQAGLLLRGKPDNFFFNDYKLMERIGKGRMAGIYKAVHQLGQIVAIKVLPPSRAKEPESFGRFQREARLAIKLKHPNAVRTFQTGTANGLHYLVMEYLDGETLDEVLARRKQLAPGEAARVVYQALLGLQHIQEQDMVHRDLKPANLMLVPGQVRGQPDTTVRATVKILDIGLGRALFDEGAPGAGENFNLTTAGDMLGEPDYLAPEQARDAHGSDIRADIYSLGCVLYHCLTGQPPFPDTNKVRQMVRHATEQAKPVKEFNAAIPDTFQAIINQMMAKDPAQRFPTPERAAQALQGLITSGQEVQKPVEEEKKMQDYLTWLDGSVDELAAAQAAQAPAPAAAAPMAIPLPQTAGPRQAAPQAVPLPAAAPRPAAQATRPMPVPAQTKPMPPVTAPAPARPAPPPPPPPRPAPVATQPMPAMAPPTGPYGLSETVIPGITPGVAPPAPQYLQPPAAPRVSLGQRIGSLFKMPDLNQMSSRQYIILGFAIGAVGAVLAGLVILVLTLVMK